MGMLDSRGEDSICRPRRTDERREEEKQEGEAPIRRTPPPPPPPVVYKQSRALKDLYVINKMDKESADY